MTSAANSAQCQVRARKRAQHRGRHPRGETHTAAWARNLSTVKAHRVDRLRVVSHHRAAPCAVVVADEILSSSLGSKAFLGQRDSAANDVRQQMMQMMSSGKNVLKCPQSKMSSDLRQKKSTGPVSRRQKYGGDWSNIFRVRPYFASMHASLMRFEFFYLTRDPLRQTAEPRRVTSSRAHTKRGA